jgi:hypothetical protein
VEEKGEDGDRRAGEGEQGDKDGLVVREYGESETEGRSGVTGG